MKFQIGERAYIWRDNGNGFRDGNKVEIIGWKRTDKGIRYHCDNLSSDLPFFIDESLLVSEREYQDIAQRLINGDLANTFVGRWMKSPDNWFIHPRRGNYGK